MAKAEVVAADQVVALSQEAAEAAGAAGDTSVATGSGHDPDAQALSLTVIPQEAARAAGVERILADRPDAALVSDVVDAASACASWGRAARRMESGAEHPAGGVGRICGTFGKASTMVGVRTTVDPRRARGTWTFLTNHAHVLVCIADEPDIRGRDIAERVGITERAAQAIVADLVAAGYVLRRRAGRRNCYSINLDGPMRHPLDQGHTVRELCTALGHCPVAPSRDEAGPGADAIQDPPPLGLDAAGLAHGGGPRGHRHGPRPSRTAR